MTRPRDLRPAAARRPNRPPRRRRLLAAVVVLAHVTLAAASVAHAVAANPARDSDCTLCHLVRHLPAVGTAPVRLERPGPTPDAPAEPCAVPAARPARPTTRSRAPPCDVP